MRRLLFVVLLVLVLGCQSPEKVMPPKSVPVDGQVFIVTKGRENVKLALVTVEAYPESAALRAIAAGEAELESAQTERDAMQQSATSIDRLAREHVDLRRRYYEALDRGEAGYDKTEAISARMERAKADHDRELERLSRLQAQYARFTSGQSYLEKLPGSSISAKSDADGRFRVSLPVGKRFAFAAHAGRETPGDREEYYWFVWFTPRDSVENRIMLSNDNLVTSGSPESAIQLPR